MLANGRCFSIPRIWNKLNCKSCHRMIYAINPIDNHLQTFETQCASSRYQLPTSLTKYSLYKIQIRSNHGDRDPPACPQCRGNLTYFDGMSSFICPDCSHEWSVDLDLTAFDNEDEVESTYIVKDCNGNALINGDNVILNKDLKVKGGNGTTLKKGHKMKNIKLVDGGGGHDVEAEGIFLKSQFLKKA